MTKHDEEVRIILRNIQAMGKPYPNGVMVGAPKPWPPKSWAAAPEPEPEPDRRYLWSRVGFCLSCFFASSAIALFLVNINAL